ncbi:MAG: hypothetical protein AAF725_25505, partial [Acidobacteriota bacterium]
MQTQPLSDLRTAHRRSPRTLALALLACLFFLPALARQQSGPALVLESAPEIAHLWESSAGEPQ